MADIAWLLAVFLVVLAVVTVCGVLLIAFTTGFKKSGRLMGGLFVIVGAPGEGKTYLATHFALEAMKAGRVVFSNYPIKSVCGKYVSRRWKKEYIKENITRCMVIADEIYRDHFSRNFKEFTEQDALDYSTLGQREVSFYPISQSQLSYDVHINRVTNLYIKVSKVEIPFLNMPLYFNVEVWDSLEKMTNSIYHPDLEPYDAYRVWFDKDVAMAYDTQFFAQDKRPLFKGQTWDEYYASLTPPVLWSPPKEISLKRTIMLYIGGILNRCIMMILKVWTMIRSVLDVKNTMVKIVWMLWVYWVFSSVRVLIRRYNGRLETDWTEKVKTILDRYF